MGKTILFTGGGTAGHVMVNLALIPKFREDGWEIIYIGSENGIEKSLVTDLEGVTYYSVSTGKLRRYFDWNNFKDPFKVLKGIFQAYRLIRKHKPNLIFSKGGFVSVPVVLGGWLNRVPVVIHESDITPGLANKIAIPFATKVCTTFPETTRHFDKEKAKYVGAIIRDELKKGDAERGRALCGFNREKPVILIMGGSLGSRILNQVVRKNLDSLLARFQVVHLCGKGQVDDTLQKPGYCQFEYLSEPLADVLNMADFVVSRAGSNAIFEFLSLNKPMLLIPLSKAASRGDQILNARSFEKMGYAQVLMEEDLSDETFLEQIDRLLENKDVYREKMSKNSPEQSMNEVIQLIKLTARSY
ncbi:undecaprenyldiphospho-muramoylpentapeptide beta-N-acetylglucosaminyltransferase [Thermoactinomyces mirandus]|uniref:UDP-N-acetylglucosamine--N-acetylmuramyl-(pentapeptide) pyrophosphoryl-undecaprenol N-acetylglucosamine transferase n=1 Tax=Thermoactinomyces mirandus TaxID=2756294 RepID=A0A7W1XRV5_9BACL|nr:undecaprenyldiphospho-muramoylpentapeptide beta-N-acetylglucosaminyltransferase [Thermoactinomyces mirandus]MBA4602148.1 undecaprenyldiphospho-muramoylpentapeptide beta-N-acetylglucosaminyltransferase [Thermoactinomyces mirandus]